MDHQDRRTDRAHRVGRLAHPHGSDIRSARPHLRLRTGSQLSQDDRPRGRARRHRPHRRRPAEPSRSRGQPRRRRSRRSRARRRRGDDRRGCQGDRASGGAACKPGGTTGARRARAAVRHDRRDGGPARRPAQPDPFVGPVIGFALTLDGRSRPGAVGHRRHRSLRRPAPCSHRPRARRRIVHIGAVKFPMTVRWLVHDGCCGRRRTHRTRVSGSSFPCMSRAGATSPAGAAAARVRRGSRVGARPDPLAAARRGVS